MNKFDNWELHDNKGRDELDTVEEFAYSLISTVEEMRSLRRENAVLKKKLEERNSFIDDQFRKTQNQVGNILSGLIRSAEEKSKPKTDDKKETNEDLPFDSFE